MHIVVQIIFQFKISKVLHLTEKIYLVEGKKKKKDCIWLICLSSDNIAHQI